MTSKYHQNVYNEEYKHGLVLAYGSTVANERAKSSEMAYMQGVTRYGAAPASLLRMNREPCNQYSILCSTNKTFAIALLFLL
jgi:hypothetical protein